MYRFKTGSLFSAAVLALMASPASATLVLDVDFGNTADGLTLAPLVGTGPTNLNATFEAEADTNAFISADTGNGILHVQKTSAGDGIGFYAPTVAVPWGSISFDYYEPTTASARFRLQLNSERVEFQDGSAEGGSYPLDQVIRVDVLFNTTTTEQTSNGITVGADRFVVYIDGVLEGGQLNIGESAINSFKLQSLASVAGQYVDNVQAFSEEFNVIPEPASLALLGLGGLLTIPRRRRA